MTTQNIFQFLSVICCGLIAGLLFGYSCSVNIGLKSLPDNEYIKAMQAINIAIQNPYFLTVFLCLILILPVTSFLQYKEMAYTSFYFILTTTLIYFVGVFGITIFCNVPLNEQLAKFDVSAATINEIATMRQSFEKSWNTYHSIRTIASIVSFGLTILSVFKSKL
jgi:uncharacterized membrane protein